MDLLEALKIWFMFSVKNMFLLALQGIHSYNQLAEERLPQAWRILCALLRVYPRHAMKKNELFDIFYNGLTTESRAYLDSFVGCIFKEKNHETSCGIVGKYIEKS